MITKKDRLNFIRVAMRTMRRRVCARAASGAALVALLALWPTLALGERGVVINDARVTDNGRTVATVLKGTEVEILGVAEDGYRIRYRSGERIVVGSIERNALIPLREPAGPLTPPEEKPSRFKRTKLSATERYATSRFKWEEVRVGRFTLLYEGKRFRSGIALARLEPIVQAILNLLYDPSTNKRYEFRDEVRLYLCRDAFADLAKKVGLDEGEAAFAEAAPAFFFNCAATPVSTNTLIYFLTDAIFGRYMDVDQYPAWLRDGLSVHVETLMGVGVKHLDSLPDLPDIDLLLDPIKSARNLSERVYQASCGALVGFLLDTYGGKAFAALCHNLKRAPQSKSVLFRTYRFGSTREFNRRFVRYVKEWRAKAIEAELDRLEQ